MKSTNSLIPAAVVLNWNQSKMTLDCVATLRKQNRQVDILIVVDNGSRSEERRILDGLDKDVRFVQLAANCGFAGGMNRGIEEALELNADYIWLMNNDAFPDPNCLSRLIDALAEDSTLAAVTPRLVGKDGFEQHAGGRYNFDTAENELFSSSDLLDAVGNGGYWLTGTAPLFRADVLRQLRGFDERFFAYWEDIDLFFRVAAAGYQFRAVPEVHVDHLGSASSGGEGGPFVFYMLTRNHVMLLEKHVKGGLKLAMRLYIVREILNDAGRYTIHKRLDRATALVQSLVAIMLREHGVPKYYSRFKTIAAFIAKHPWWIIRGIDLFRSILDRKTIRSNVSPELVQGAKVASFGVIK